MAGVGSKIKGGNGVQESTPEGNAAAQSSIARFSANCHSLSRPIEALSSYRAWCGGDIMYRDRGDVKGTVTVLGGQQ